MQYLLKVAHSGLSGEMWSGKGQERRQYFVVFDFLLNSALSVCSENSFFNKVSFHKSL